MNSNLYQKGYSIMLGVTGGYQFQLSDRWNLDIYATIGTSQSFYKGYDRTTGDVMILQRNLTKVVKLSLTEEV
jgi:hypothetical protein